MSLDPLVFITARDHGRAALAAATPDEARAVVLAHFDHHMRADEIDGEHLVYAGVVVGQAGHTDLDADVARSQLELRRLHPGLAGDITRLRTR